MLSRFNVFALLLDQLKSMRKSGSGRPALLARVLVILAGPIGIALSLWFDWRMQSISELSAALGLLAGVFLSAFAIVFSIRLTLSTSPSSSLKRIAAQRMDEGALTLLAAGLLAGADALWLSIVAATTIPGHPVGSLRTAVAVGLSCWVAIYFLLSVRRLHALYVTTFPPPWKARAAVEGNRGSRRNNHGVKGSSDRKQVSP
ncbi:hypothetical protein ACFVRV_06200 [Arthrobacter koreensis]|uniref:hypothetical protein n=1 Tax=Arthrobacter koreensis TaxID=199136 RepID=UPI0036D9EA1B